MRCTPPYPLDPDSLVGPTFLPDGWKAGTSINHRLIFKNQNQIKWNQNQTILFSCSSLIPLCTPLYCCLSNSCTTENNLNLHTSPSRIKTVTVHPKADGDHFVIIWLVLFLFQPFLITSSNFGDTFVVIAWFSLFSPLWVVIDFWFHRPICLISLLFHGG